jgi:hypothetical protein
MTDTKLTNIGFFHTNTKVSEDEHYHGSDSGDNVVGNFIALELVVIFFAECFVFSLS